MAAATSRVTGFEVAGKYGSLPGTGPSNPIVARPAKAVSMNCCRSTPSFIALITWGLLNGSAVTLQQRPFHAASLNGKGS